MRENPAEIPGQFVHVGAIEDREVIARHGVLFDDLVERLRAFMKRPV